MSRPGEKLQLAIAEFTDALKPEERARFQAHQISPGPDAVIRLTTALDAEQAERGEQCTGTRLHSILQSIREFSSVIDTCVSSNPCVAALVWGSVKFVVLVNSASRYHCSNLTIIQIAAKAPLYMQRLSKMFMEMKADYPRFSEYQAIFADSLRVQKALCDFYSVIVLYCKQILLVSRRQGREF